MTKKKTSILILLGVVFLGLILRTPITAVGAIVGPLKSILDINNTVAGFITTIPINCICDIQSDGSKIIK